MSNRQYSVEKKVRSAGPRTALPVLPALALLFGSCAAATEAPVIYTYKVIRTLPHDARNFTQGLVYRDGFLYEGTGLYDRSILTKREFETNEIIKRYRLPRKYFGEGITLFKDKIIQLTWKARTGFYYDEATFRQLGQFRYDSEGWGLTHNGTHLIRSDGSDTLYFLDPNTYAETGRIEVRSNDRPVYQLNELEFIDGRIYANVLPSDYIAIIDPATGQVTGWIDLRGLYTAASPSSSPLNGIAYLPDTKHLLVTGKLWPHLYEIEVIPPDPNAP